MLTVSADFAEKIKAAAQNANQTVEAYLNDLLDQFTVNVTPILENLPDVIYTFDLSTRTVDYINRQSFLGYPLDELTQPQSLFARILPEDRDRLYKYWLSIAAGDADEKAAVTFRLKDTQDGWRWIKLRHSVMERTADQTPLKLLIHLTDDTIIKEAEQAASHNEQRLESIFAAMTEGIVFLRSDGTIETSNDSAHHILDLSTEQIAGQLSIDHGWQAVREDGTSFPLDEHPAVMTLRTGEATSGVIMGVHKPGEELKWISINTQPLFQHGESVPYAVVATFADITQKKQQESQLRILMKAIEQSPVSVVITDIEANITYVNTQFARLTGYAPGEVIGQNPRILQSGKTPRETFFAMWQTLRRGEVWRGEMINRKKNGDVYYELAIISPIRNEGGETTHYVAVKEDITERKQFEQALQEGERVAREFQEHLKTLHDMSLELANIASLNELYRRAVDTGLHRLGFDRVALFLIDYPTDTVLGTYGTDPHGDIRPEFDHRSSLQVQAHLVNQVLHNKERAALWEEAPLIDYDERVGDGWNAMAGLWDGDNAIGFFAVDNYLTGRPPRLYERELLSLYGKTVGHLVVRQRSLQALQQSEQQVRTLMQHTPTCILIADVNGMIESGNQQTAHLLGYERVDQLIGKPIYQFLPSLPPLEKLSESRSLHLGLKHDFFVVRQDESTLPVEMVLTNIELQDEPRLVLFMNDLSTHIELEDQRLQLAIEKERSDVLAKFIQDASHEFRTPLTVIKNRAFLIQSDNPDEKVRQNVQKIDAQVDHIVSLVEDLAYIAQLDSMSELAVEKHNIVDVIDAVIKEFRAELDQQEVTLTFAASAVLPDVRCNVHELREALVRIINNAIRYNREGGQVMIRCSHEDGAVVVDIQDTGIGIDKAYLPHIFDRFYRMDTAHKTHGFGLGLAIARKIITLHHGTISIESEPNQGTTVRITLPA